MAKKQKLSVSIDQYNKIVWNSIKSAWHHPELWIVGALAGLATTGASFNHLFKAIWRVQPADTVSVHTLTNALDALPWLTTYINKLALTPTPRLVFTLFSWLVLIVGITIVVVGAQHMVLTAVHRRHARKKPQKFRTLLTSLEHWHFWRIFAVDALVYIATAILLGLTSLTLSALLGSSAAINTAAYIAVYLFALPLALIVNIFGMLTMVRMVAKERGIMESFLDITNMLRKHWLVTVEVSLLLLLLNFVATVGIILGVMLYAGLVGIIGLTAIAAGSILLTGIVAFFGALGGAILMIGYGGFITTVNYSVWTGLEQRLERHGAVPILESAVRKVIKRKH